MNATERAVALVRSCELNSIARSHARSPMLCRLCSERSTYARVALVGSRALVPCCVSCWRVAVDTWLSTSTRKTVRP